MTDGRGSVFSLSSKQSAHPQELPEESHVLGSIPVDVGTSRHLILVSHVWGSSLVGVLGLDR